MQTDAGLFKTPKSPHIELKGAAGMDWGEKEESLVNPSSLELPGIASTQPSQYIVHVL